jgi:hypothetical protein
VKQPMRRWSNGSSAYSITSLLCCYVTTDITISVLKHKAGNAIHFPCAVQTAHTGHVAICSHAFTSPFAGPAVSSHCCLLDNRTRSAESYSLKKSIGLVCSPSSPKTQHHTRLATFHRIAFTFYSFNGITWKGFL